LTFYDFAVEIAQLILYQSVAPTVAIEKALSNWARLVRHRRLLDPAQQIGLYGELYLLDTLVRKSGVRLVDSWIGPRSEPHDFRLGSIEIEVKSTLQTRRIHRIHGLGQLEPSQGMALHLLSYQFEPSGAADTGKSLSEKIDAIRVLLSADAKRLASFDSSIDSIGYKAADAAFYRHPLKLRTPPQLIPVDHQFPRLTREMIDRNLPNGSGPRISYVEYELNLDGLGYPEASNEYRMIFSKVLCPEANQ
jgi:hypothetical protein